MDGAAHQIDSREISDNQKAQKMLIKPLFIGVTGGTASGKTSLCKRITERIGLSVSYIALDSFYKGLS